MIEASKCNGARKPYNKKSVIFGVKFAESNVFLHFILFWSDSFEMFDKVW